MKQIELIRKLMVLDRQGIYVFARRDVEKLFPEEAEKAMEKSLQRMVGEGLLQRVARGLYLNLQPEAKPLGCRRDRESPAPWPSFVRQPRDPV
jgi:predicted transcriptional regulator of viral defense system